MNICTEWKHQNIATPLAKVQITHIAVFDDEQPGFLSLYQTNGTLFYPCRSVAGDDGGHLERTLLAWADSAPLLDLRIDKTRPLPTAEERKDETRQS